MAIRVRRGLKANFDPNKLLPGELGVVTDSGELYFCFNAGYTKKLQTESDVVALLNASPVAYTALQQCIADLNNNPSELTNILNNIAALQNGKAPTSHASAANTYGLGTTANYGHAKTINALTQSAHADGTALSAYQGYILNQNKIDKSSVANNAITTAAGLVLDARQGKALQDQITEQNNNLAYIHTDISPYKNTMVVGTTSICYADINAYFKHITIGLALVSQSLGMDSITLFTGLPTVLRPMIDTFGVLCATSGDFAMPIRITVDGNLIAIRTPSTAKYVMGDIFYI